MVIRNGILLLAWVLRNQIVGILIDFKNQLLAWEVLKKNIIIEKAFTGARFYFAQRKQGNAFFIEW